MAPKLTSPAFRPTRLGAAGWWFGLALVLLSGCEAPDAQMSRTEPWLKDDVALSRVERAFVLYRAERGQFLSFTVQSKQGTLRGKVPLSGAELSIDPTALDHSRGELSFDLGGLSLEQAPPADSLGAAPTEDPLLTRAARAWLSLGSEVPQAERAEARSARFGIRLGRELSSHSILGGLVISSGRAGQSAAAASVRRVSGIVDGDLLLLGREVSHVLKVELDFLSSAGEGSKTAPASVVVRLSQAEPVPLSEHGIKPRDERGALLGEQVAALGKRSSLRALVTGSLSFVRSSE